MPLSDERRRVALVLLDWQCADMMRDPTFRLRCRDDSLCAVTDARVAAWNDGVGLWVLSSHALPRCGQKYVAGYSVDACQLDRGHVARAEHHFSLSDRGPHEWPSYTWVSSIRRSHLATLHLGTERQTS